MAVDLHLHTTASDGTWRPEQLVREAHRAGLTAIAVTDHDTMDGLAEALEAATGLGMAFLTGVELSSDSWGEEVHILGYGIRSGRGGLDDLLTEMQANREDRLEKMVQVLQDLGMPIELERVRQLATGSSPGRSHLARAMLEKGLVSSTHEAFERYLAHGRPGYVKRYRVDPGQAASLIHEAGGVAIWAHPGERALSPLMGRLMEAGLDGIEVYHPSHPAELVPRLLQTAKESGLLWTGGSDCHGPAGKDAILLGSMGVPDEVYNRLHRAICQRFGG